MFDIGMGELGLIAVVGLLVLGPERLPRVARTAGILLRKARSSWQSVRADIERELETEELKRSIQKSMAQADPTPDLRRAMQPIVEAPRPAEPPANSGAPPGSADGRPLDER